MSMKEHLQKHHSVNPKAMKKGGPTSEDRKRMGKGMAKVANQRKPVRRVRKTGI